LGERGYEAIIGMGDPSEKKTGTEHNKGRLLHGRAISKKKKKRRKKAEKKDAVKEGGGKVKLPGEREGKQ